MYNSKNADRKIIETLYSISHISRNIADNLSGLSAEEQEKLRQDNRTVVCLFGEFVARTLNHLCSADPH